MFGTDEVKNVADFNYNLTLRFIWMRFLLRYICHSFSLSLFLINTHTYTHTHYRQRQRYTNTNINTHTHISSICNVRGEISEQCLPLKPQQTTSSKSKLQQHLSSSIQNKFFFPNLFLFNQCQMDPMTTKEILQNLFNFHRF